MIDIKRIFILPVSREDSNLLALARIELASGLFLSELRVYPDTESPNGIFIMYPTRKTNTGETIKVFYPNTNRLREFLELEIHKAFLKKLKESEHEPNRA